MENIELFKQTMDWFSDKLDFNPFVTFYLNYIDPAYNGYYGSFIISLIWFLSFFTFSRKRIQPIFLVCLALALTCVFEGLYYTSRAFITTSMIESSPFYSHLNDAEKESLNTKIDELIKFKNTARESKNDVISKDKLPYIDTKQILYSVIVKNNCCKANTINNGNK